MSGTSDEIYYPSKITQIYKIKAKALRTIGGMTEDRNKSYFFGIKHF